MNTMPRSCLVPYITAREGEEADSSVPVPYGNPALRWFLASQLVRTLRSFTVVDLDDLVPAA